MLFGDRGKHSDVRTSNPTERGQLARSAGPQFQYHDLDIFVRLQQSEGQANVVVQIAPRGQSLLGDGADLGQNFFGGRTASDR